MNGPRALRLLDLEPEQATAPAVRQAYLDLVRVWHPDRFGADARLQRKAAGRLSEINLAYEFLTANPCQPIAPAGDAGAGPRQAWGAAPPASAAPPTGQRSRSLRRAARTLGHFSIAAALIAGLLFMATPHAAPLNSASVWRADTSLPSQPALDVRPPAPQPLPPATPRRHTRSPFSRDLDRVLARAHADSRPASPR